MCVVRSLATRGRAVLADTARGDLLIGAALAPVVVLNRLLDTPWWALAGAMLGTVLALAFTRSWPWAALLATVTLTLWSPNALVAAAFVAFRIGQRGVRVTPLVLGAGALLSVVAVALPWVTRFVTLEAVATIPMCAVPAWAVGHYLRRRDHVDQCAREGIAQEARLRERGRIANDLHDSLGHEIGLIAIRAGALEVSPHGADPAVREAAVTLRLGATRAAERLREVIGVLHPRRGDTTPREGVPALVRRARESGVAVTLRLDGDPDQVPDMVGRAVHRLVQEGLTNATKHAPGAAVTVGVEHTETGTAVTLTNGPPTGDAQAHAGSGSGMGLEGLRERVELSGGTFSATPSEGGFAVNAWLPHTPVAALPTGAVEESAATAPLPPHLVAAELRRLRWRLARTVIAVAAVAIAVAVLAGHYGW